IVENGIYHGIKNKRFKESEKGMISVKIMRNDSKIVILINDNGIGMDSTVLSRINGGMNRLDSPKSSGYGLKNVKQRLILFFGKDIDFNITSEMNIGTTFEIIVPYKEN
ncbi:MAG TPA: ATP-binding protein, partial [Anaerovoracaceae bacterium]|nr:ATP-binding protein [Anaerovoracaceae bacterium]